MSLNISNRTRLIVIGLALLALLAVAAFSFSTHRGAHAAPPNSAVVINDTGCSLFDGQGGFAFTDQSHSVVTNNGNGLLTCKATDVAPAPKGAVHYDANNNPYNQQIQCGTPAGLTLDWEEVVTPSGNAQLVCHVHP
jgi:hypothetical protein